VPAGEQPGLGRRLSFIVPTGHRVELFAEVALSEDGPMTRPVAMCKAANNEVLRRRR
jgi:hypothetical protein